MTQLQKPKNDSLSTKSDLDHEMQQIVHRQPNSQIIKIDLNNLVLLMVALNY